MASSDFKALEQGLGYQFKNRELIIEALTHRSHFHEFGDSSHNERLEFLGDAVIDLCVTEKLMNLSPHKDEGDLSKMRSQLVSEGALAKAGQKLKLGEFIRLGRGEDRSGGRQRDALLADTFEAVLAAVYLDGGLEAARRVTLACLDNVTREASAQLLSQDFKSRLQEICQSLGLGAPAYKCVETRGPDHQRKFVMALYIQDFEVVRSEGTTKKEATQIAAHTLLDQTGSAETLVKLLQKNGFPAKSSGAKTKTTKNKPKKTTVPTSGKSA